MDYQEMLSEWHSRIRRSHFAHNVAGAMFEHRHRIFGAAAAIISFVVGTAVFVTLEESPNVYLRTLAGLLSIAAAVLAGLQTVLNYSERAHKHRTAAIRYGELRTEIEQLQALPQNPNAAAQIAESLRARWKALNDESPIISEPIWRRADRRIEMSKAGTSVS